MDSFFTRFKNPMVLIAIVLTQVIALAIQVQRPARDAAGGAREMDATGGGPDGRKVTLLRRWTILGITPVERVVHGSSLKVRWVWDGYIDLRHTQQHKEQLKQDYAARYGLVANLGKQRTYAQVRESYNTHPNGADLVFLCRTCYGGVVRFRKLDGYMSTPVGIHDPMPPGRFATRVDAWHARTSGTEFHHMDFSEAMSLAGRGDLVYCDPPYRDRQSILYGAQSFSLDRLLQSID